MKIVNFFGAPGAGKTTAALGLTYSLKKMGCNAEYISEFAKDLIWRRSGHLLEQQYYMFAKQKIRMDSLRGNSDIVVSDSPIPLSIFYSPRDYSVSFKRAVLEFFKEYDNVNFLVERSHDYEESGRIQGEVESDRLCAAMREFMCDANIPHYRIKAVQADPDNILAHLSSRNELGPTSDKVAECTFESQKTGKPLEKTVYRRTSFNEDVLSRFYLEGCTTGHLAFTDD